MIRAGFVALLTGLAGAAAAFEPTLPAGAQVLMDGDRASSRYDLAVGPFRDGRPDLAGMTGSVHRTTWKLANRATPEQVLTSLRADLQNAGYAPVFECWDRACGGFDFRFSIDVAPDPSMYVNLSNFAYLAAMTAAGDAVAVLVSATGSETYVQLDRVTRPAGGNAATDPGPALMATGRVVLDIPPASAGAAVPVLAGLARFLTDRPEARIAIVAHSGTSDQDDAARAEGLAEARSVRARLVAEYGVDPDRVEAFWLGPFTPRASPVTSAGQALNRRIEAVLLPQ